MATIWITSDTSGLIIDDGNDYSALSGAVVDGSELINGTLNAGQPTGATLKNFTVTGGTMLVRDPINKADTITLNGGTLNLQRGGSAVNLDINGGALTTNVAAWGGGYVSTVRISAGTIMLVDGADAYDITQTGGTTYVTSGATVTGFNYNGGTLNISSGATINGLTKNGGALSIKLYDGMTLNNYTLNTGWTEVFAGGKISGGTFNSPSGVIAYSGGILENVELKQGQIQIQTGAIVDGLIYTAGTLSISSGVTITNLTKNAATSIDLNNGKKLINYTLNSGWTTVGAGTEIRGATVNTPSGIVVYADGLMTDVELKQGQIQVQNNATISGVIISGGSLGISAAAIANDITLNSGTLSIANGATINNLTKNGGTNPVLKDGTTFTNYTQNAGWTEVSSGGRIKGGSFNGGCGVIVYAGGVIEDVTRAGSYELRMQGGVWSGGAITGGKVLATYNNGGALLRDITVSAGELDIFSSVNSAEDIRLKGGKTYLLDGAKMTNTEVYDGAQLLIRSASVDGITVYSGGKVTSFSTPGTITMNDLSVRAGGSMLIAAGFVLTGETEIEDGSYIYVGNTDTRDEDVTAVNGTIYNLNLGIGGTIGDGVTLSNFTQTGGALNVSSGAAIVNINHSAGWLVISGGATLTDGTINNAGGAGVIAYTGAVIENIELKSGQIQAQGALVSGGSITGGTMHLTYDAGALVNDITVSGGTLELSRVGNSGTNLNIATGTVQMYAGATVSGVDMTGGSLRLNDAATQTGVERAAMTVDDVTMSSGGIMLRGTNVSASNITMLDGIIYVQNGAVAENVKISGGVVSTYLQTASATVDYNASGTTLKNAILSDGEIFIGGSAVADNVTVLDGQLNVDGYDNLVSGVTVSGGSMFVGNGRVADLNILTGGELTLSGNFAFEGDINFAEGTLTNDADAKASGGVIEDLDLAINGTFGSGITLSNFTQSGGTVNITSDGAAKDVVIEGGRFNVASGATMSDASFVAGSLTVFESAGITGFEQAGGRVIVYGTDAAINGATVYGGNMSVGNGGALNDATISGGTVVVRHVAGWAYNENLTATASDVRIETGAGMNLESGGILSAGKLADGANLTVYKGGQAGLTSAAAGAEIDLSFWDVNVGAPGNEDALISDWGDFSANAKVNVHSLETGYSYKIVDASNANVTLNCGTYRIFDESVKSGEQHSNAFLGRNLDFSDGMTLITSSFSVDVAVAAAALGTGTATALADGGFAAIWTADTDTSSVSVVADANTTGDAWVTVNGATLATPLYGAQGNFAHDVNMWIYEGTIRNLAAGATAGGSVENVNLLISDNGEGTDKLTFSGTAYLGGFGSVTGEVTAVVYGGSYEKDFYAGALANKLATATSVGDVNLAVTGGKFSGNLFGASAVKTVDGTGSGIRNTTGDVNLTLAGGEAAKSDFCCFAGGYATGSATGTVYTVDSISATVSGGSWGTAHGGRGIFGGIYASQVTAEAGDIELTITDGTMGNVYGGGWAQKNGTSIVGDVNLTISGGTIANVFGGGATSTSGGSTQAGDVTITVSGGTISGDIFARGQSATDVVASADVIFTGNDNFACGVYGYTFVEGAASDATLSFTGYTGEFSGPIGGFDDGIILGGSTNMTLTTAAEDVSNSSWIFDVSARAETLADTAMLDWDAADFTDDVITLNLTTGLTSEWTLIDAAATTAYNEFDVLVDGISQGVVTLDEQIADGDYQGWGFTLEDTVLKFKNLANA